jgi:putative ABC transport system permease protein
MMFSHYLVVAVRLLRKRPSFSIINVLGLALALAACLFLFLYVHYETHYDAFWNNSANVYRVTHQRFQNGELSLKSAKAYWGMVQVLTNDLPEVAAGTHIFKDVVTVMNNENHIQNIAMFGAESTFFDVFNLTFLDKKSANPLSDLYSSVLSESAAIKLFGTTKAVGKWFKVNQSWEFEVTGVYKDLPANTHLPFDLLLSKQTYLFYMSNWNDELNKVEIKDPDGYKKAKPVTSWDWGYAGTYTYLLLRAKSDPRQVEAKINQLAGTYLKGITKDGGRVEFHLQRLGDIHLNSNLNSEIMANQDRKSVVVMGVLAVVILVIAWINFVNLSLARSLERAKEVAIRKVAGASRSDLIAQHLLECALLNMLSVAVAACLVILLQPVLWGILGRKPVSLELLASPFFLLACLVVFLIGVVVSGLYPAFIQSSYGSMSLFKPRHKVSFNAIDPRKVLVIFQFAAAIMLVSGVITIYRQIAFMRQQDLGVNIQQVLVTYSPMSMIGNPKQMSSLETYKARVKALPGVESVATASVLPGKEILWQRQDVRKTDDLPNTRKNYDYCYVDRDFIPAFNLSLAAGRNFSDNRGAETNSIIINEAARQQLGFADARSAVDSFILLGDKHFKIIGVLKNYHQESLKKEIRPILYHHGYQWMFDVGYYAVRIKTADVSATVKAIREIWGQIYLVDHFEHFFLDDAFDLQYREDRRFGAIFTLFTVLAIAIACLGLFGLATHSVQKRTKEIGIRKVNGATATEIILMLSRDFATWVGVAFVIAYPVSYWILQSWLQNFAYRIRLSWMIFVAAGLVALLVAMATVFFQAYRAATRNPVESLRYE